MNVADSQRVASALEHLGYESTTRPDNADVIVMNTCVVRQSAEDKAYWRLSSLMPIKERRPEVVINLMGCLVGVKGHEQLKARFPYVDVFSPPSDPGPLLAYLTQDESYAIEQADTEERFAFMDGEVVLPQAERGQLVSAFIPVVLGCSHACTFCIIPNRRGAERSRQQAQILAEARSMAAQGVREITLLGQIVDRYGKDRPGETNLAGLIRQLHEIEEIKRIRFLTSHPNWMTDELLDVVAELPKVCPHIEVPIQAGDDAVLEGMKRGYTAEDYRQLVARIRQRIPGVSIATDIIVGFPGESAEAFQRTYDLLAELRLDVAHLARYSPRPGTVATRRMEDDVPADEKMRRFRLLEELQEGIAAEIHYRYLGQKTTILFEEQVKGRWKGRTPTNKLVFVTSHPDGCSETSHENLRGLERPVEITWTGPWSMQCRLV